MGNCAARGCPSVQFCQMMLRVRRARARVSTKRARSLPSSTTSALSRATSVLGAGAQKQENIRERAANTELNTDGVAGGISWHVATKSVAGVEFRGGATN
jgi:hypothetical protein